jgi:hypothetical protein
LTIQFSLILPVMAKEITREQAERKRAQAATFMERIGDSNRAEEFERMSTDEYAERRGLILSNPSYQRRRTPMATVTTKADLQDQLDQIADILDDAYAPERTREDLAAAVGDAFDIARGESADDSEDDSDDDSDSDEMD